MAWRNRFEPHADLLGESPRPVPRESYGPASGTFAHNTLTYNSSRMLPLPQLGSPLVVTGRL